MSFKQGDRVTFKLGRGGHGKAYLLMALAGDYVWLQGGNLTDKGSIFDLSTIEPFELPIEVGSNIQSRGHTTAYYANAKCLAIWDHPVDPRKCLTITYGEGRVSNVFQEDFKRID